jgi:hypothetical protein
VQVPKPLRVGVAADSALLVQPPVGGRRIRVGGRAHPGAFVAQFRQRHPAGGVNQPAGLAGVGGGRAADQRRLRRGQLAAAQRGLHRWLRGQPLRGVDAVLGLPGGATGAPGQFFSGRPRPGAPVGPVGVGHPPCQECLARGAQSFGRVQHSPQLARGGTVDQIRVQPVHQLGQPVANLYRIVEHVFESRGTH